MPAIHWLLARCLFYPSLGWNLLLCRLNPQRHWWDRVDDHVLVGAIPFRSDVPQLVAEGVRAIVNTCVEFSGLSDAYEAAGIEQLHIPTVDFTAPTLEDIERAVEFITRHARGQNSVYVHCKAGRGRSATVAVCWLIANGLSPKEAQNILQERRPHVVRTVHQRQVVKQFAEKYRVDGSI